MMWMPIRSVRAAVPGLLLALSACAAYPTEAGPVAVADTGTGTIRVTPELLRRVQALVAVTGPGDINHLVVKLFALGSGGESERAAIDVTDPARFTSPVGFTHLRADTTYRVRAYAYASAGTGALISVPASSFVDVAVTRDDRPTLAKLQVTLTDVPFDGLGSATGVSVTDGGFLSAPRGVVTTFAGTGAPGAIDGPPDMAQFTSPAGLAFDGAGNLYVADAGLHRIRKLTSAGTVSTLAGSTAGNADGTGTYAQFNGPCALAVDSAGTLYVCEASANRIRKVTASGTASAWVGGSLGTADGTGTAAQFNGPAAAVLDGAGNLYVADALNHRIRKVTATGVVTTLAGGTRGYADGAGTSAQFDTPSGLALDAAGTLYVADTNNGLIRTVTATGVVATLAGGTPGFADGTGAVAKFNQPRGLAVDARQYVYVADEGNHAVRVVSPDGAVTTLAGGTSGAVDGTGAAAQFVAPRGLAIDASGVLYVGDRTDARIRKLQ